MKLFLKRFSMVLLVAIVLYMQTIIIPQERQKAEAWAIALPAGITLGAGIYVLGALTIGAVAMAINESYGEEIQAHAKKVWGSATQLAKDSLYYTYDLAYQAGEYMVELGGDFLNFVSSKKDHLVSSALALSHTYQYINNAEKLNLSYQSDNENFSYTTTFPNVTMTRNMGTTQIGNKTISFKFNDTSKHAFVVPTNYSYTVATQITAFSTATISHYISNNPSDNKTLYISLTNPVTIDNYTTTTSPSLFFNLDIGEKTTAEMYAFISSIRSIEDLLLLAQTYPILHSSSYAYAPYTLHVADVPNIADDYIVAKENFNQTLNRVMTNPIPVPVADVYPLNPATNEPLIWDDVADTYKDILGNPYVGDVSWNIPVPQVKDIDGTTTVVIPIENDFVDVITGDVVAVPTQPTPNPPLTPPKTDWLNRMKGVVTTKFPFSLPWDFYAMLSLISAEPIKPHIEFSQSYMGMPVEFEVKFDFIDPYIVFFRTFIIIGFCISLIMGTRKLLGGAT